MPLVPRNHYKPFGELTDKEKKELINRYMKDSANLPEPWKLWEYRPIHNLTWSNCEIPPIWAKHILYRRKEMKLTGGSSDYYKVTITNPTSPELEPYTAECNDIIEALNLTYAEGNIIKAIWRIAKDRMGEGKPGVTSLYDAEKVEFFAKRLLDIERKKENEKDNDTGNT